LTPIGNAIQAGFMEECLFRAVPLSLAALIGAHFGCRRLLIGIALVLQALVFAAAHANYPGFPAYSRVVELFVPALIWGFIFLRFGLLPTVILHALFDLLLMSVPVFLVEGWAGGLNQAIVIAAALVPLTVVLIARQRAGAWGELPAKLLNGAWSPPEAAARSTALRERAGAGTWALRAQRALPLMAAAGLAAILVTGVMRADAPPLQIGRAEAEAAADAALAAHDVKLSPEWNRYSVTASAQDDAVQWQWHRFVWREAGHEAYRSLVGRWLAPPMWEVRYARFEGGDVADRAEEWRVAIDGTGKVRGISHRLPEQRAGARLSRDEARAVARRELRQAFEIDPAAVNEIEVREDPQPDRTDWAFTFADPRVDVGKGAEARAQIAIAGDEVVAASRYIFIPEDWQRAERERASRLRIVKIVVVLFLALVGLGAVIWASVAWTRDHFDRRAFWVVSAVSFVAAIVNAANQWPSMAMGLQTTEPVLRQVLLASASILIGAVIGSLLAGMLSGVASYAARLHVLPGLDAHTLWLRGAAVGLFAVGIDALVGSLSPELAPTWPRYGSENAVWPWLSRAMLTVNVLLPMAGTIVALRWLDRLTSGWTRRRALCVLLLILAEGAIAAMRADDWSDIVFTGVIGGGVSAALFALILRFDLRVVPGVIAVYLAISPIADALAKGTQQAWTLAVIAVALGLAISLAVTRYLVAAGEIAPDAPHAATPEAGAAAD
jgi:hypothetical protein